MQQHFAAAAQARRRLARHHGDVGVTERQVGVLERPDHQVDVVPVALLRLEQQEHQVGAGREVRRVGADDEALIALLRLLHGRDHHRHRVAANRVHLRMELEAEHPVANVEQAGAWILLDDAAGSLGVPRARPAPDAGPAGRRRGRCCGRRRSRPAPAPAVTVVPVARQHVLDPDRVPELERAHVPAESPPHRPIDVVDGVWRCPGRRCAV